MRIFCVFPRLDVFGDEFSEVEEVVSRQLQRQEDDHCEPVEGIVYCWGGVGGLKGDLKGGLKGGLKGDLKGVLKGG